MRTGFPSILVLLWALATGTPAVASGPLPPPIQQALERAGLPPEALAVAVLPLQPSQRPARAALLHQADRPMQPASAMKVLTSIVALDRVGPDRRSHTELRAAGPVLDGRLRADLVLRGGADPELTLPAIWSLFLEARESGLRVLEGDVVLDRTLFSPARDDIGVPPFDESPEFPYNVIPDALQFAGNLQAIELRTTGGTVSARLVPELPGVRLDNRLQLHEANAVACREWSTRGWQRPEVLEGEDGTLTLVLQGRLPRECTLRQPLQLMERNLQAQAQLRWVLRELGMTWTGRVREARPGEFDTPGAPATTLLARREARPWGEWLRSINKVSDNVATRLLYLLTGVEEAQRPAGPSPSALAPAVRSTREWAETSVRRWFAEQGIDDAGLVMDNGSGLSRRERITPRQLALVLRAGHAQMHAPDLLMSLPVAGVNGSLRARLVDTPAQGRARLKPGTLRNAVALAGYVDDPQGRRWVMAAMINHDEAPQRGRPVLDAVAAWVAAGRP